MAQEFAVRFYKSKQWKQCRNAYIMKVHGLCERCYGKGKYVPGYIVHHKILLTPNNIHDPMVSLNHEHLEYLCVDCHNEEHMGRGTLREDVMFDEDGNLIQRAPIVK